MDTGCTHSEHSSDFVKNRGSFHAANHTHNVDINNAQHSLMECFSLMEAFSSFSQRIMTVFPFNNAK